MTSDPLAQLRDLLLVSDSGTWGTEGDLLSGSPVLRSTNISDYRLDVSDVAWRSIPLGHRSSKRLEPGDILVTASSGSADHIGKCCLFEQPQDGHPYYFSNFTLRLRADPRKAEPRWLYHWLKSDRGRAALTAMNSTTSGLRNLNKTLYLSQKLPLPPLAEQRRIAAMLDKADAVRRKRRESLRLLDEFLRSAFLEMFGDPVRNEKGWQVVTLGELCNVQLGKMLSEKARAGSNPVPYLRNANVQWRRIDLSSVLEMDFTEAELARFDLHPGDLLVCEGGEVGRCAIWEGQLPRCSFQKALHRVRPKDQRLRTEYLQECLFLLSERGALVESTSQATIAHLTKVRLEGLPLPVPPGSLQQQFVELYECAKQASRRQAVRFDELDSLFDSLAQRAFSTANQQSPPKPAA